MKNSLNLWTKLTSFHNMKELPCLDFRRIEEKVIVHVVQDWAALCPFAPGYCYLIPLRKLVFM